MLLLRGGLGLMLSSYKYVLDISRCHGNAAKENILCTCTSIQRSTVTITLT
jgi:hypothetical protein